MEQLAIGPSVPVSSNEAQTMKLLKESLEDAILSKGRRYETTFTYAIRFEEDNTGACFDMEHFAEICRYLQLSPPENLVLEENGPQSPDDEIYNLLRSLEKSTDAVKGQSLIVLHYAGHGALDANGSLYFAANDRSRRWLYWESDFNRLWGRADRFQRTDVLVLLDCCHAGMATRALRPTRSRTIEIVAGVGAARESLTHSYDARNVPVEETFTARMALAISRQLGRLGGTASLLGFHNLISDLRSTACRRRDPKYYMRVGCVPILFPVGKLVHAAAGKPLPRIHPPVPGASQPSSSASIMQSQPPYSVVFTVTVDDCDLENGEHKEIINWIRRAPREVGLKLDSIFQSRFYLLTFRASWDTWLILNGLHGYKLVAEVVGENLLPAFPPDQPSGSSQENVPFPKGDKEKRGSKATG